ncbi:MAG: glutathione S-transferase family protein, partial [Methyloceanibacter sp.]
FQPAIRTLAPPSLYPPRWKTTNAREGEMPEAKPKLVTFGISHYCEKARWALDWHDIDYEEVSWPPGLHHVLIKRCGAKDTTLPLVLDGKSVIQGSGAIIDWADQKARDRGRKLTVNGSLEIEQRTDDRIGIHVRRLAYAELLPRSAHVAKPALFRNASRFHRFIGDMMWPVTRLLMMRMYEITPSAAAESRAILEDEMSWLDGILADGRPYLAGDRFSRADITVASLLAPFARPKEMPVYGAMQIPESLLADAARWRDRPVIRWVVAQYQTRPPSRGMDRLMAA